MPDSQGFRLQPVLTFKSSMVDTLEMEFARLQVAYRNEMDALLVLVQAEDKEMEVLRQQQGRGYLNCEEIQLRQQYLRVLKEHVIEQTARVGETRQQMEAKRTELVEMMKDQKALEKLRERHQAQQAKELLRREARAVDDLVITRYARDMKTKAKP
jgi:flagellar FliJ protein